MGSGRSQAIKPYSSRQSRKADPKQRLARFTHKPPGALPVAYCDLIADAWGLARRAARSSRYSGLGDAGGPGQTLPDVPDVPDSRGFVETQGTADLLHGLACPALVANSDAANNSSRLIVHAWMRRRAWHLLGRPSLDAALTLVSDRGALCTLWAGAFTSFPLWAATCSGGDQSHRCPVHYHHHYHHTTPPLLCTIPTRSYQHRPHRSASRVSVCVCRPLYI